MLASAHAQLHALRELRLACRQTVLSCDILELKKNDTPGWDNRYSVSSTEELTKSGKEIYAYIL